MDQLKYFLAGFQLMVKRWSGRIYAMVKTYVVKNLEWQPTYYDIFGAIIVKSHPKP